jgi:hypothetical protein
MTQIKFEITITRGDAERPLSKVLPDKIWKQEVKARINECLFKFEQLGDIHLEIKK